MQAETRRTVKFFSKPDWQETRYNLFPKLGKSSPARFLLRFKILALALFTPQD